ncbi:MAG TPA: hypothetical protein VH062_33105 [Polyangiaceae bacterium]|nr:hypothetical protein [Polyangiaceae bacterium]
MDPHYGYVWYCGGGLLISQVTVSHATREAVEAYHRFEEAVLRDCAVELKAAGGLFVIHDWRELESYDGVARTVWQERMRRRPKGYLRGSVVCVERANALLKMAVQAANVVASLTHGAKVELTTELAPVLARYGVDRPPSMAPSRISMRP